MNISIPRVEFEKYLMEHYKRYGHKLTFPELCRYLYDRRPAQNQRLRPVTPDFGEDLTDEAFIEYMDAILITVKINDDAVGRTLPHADCSLPGHEQPGCQSVAQPKDSAAVIPAHNRESIIEDAIIPADKDIFVLRHLRYTKNGMHSHDFFEVDYMFSGRCQMEFPLERYNLEAGDVCIAAPGLAHAVRLEDTQSVLLTVSIRKSTFEHTFFSVLTQKNLLGDFFRNILYYRPQANYLLFQTGGDQSVRRLVKNLAVANSQEDMYTNSCSIGWMNLLFSTLFRKYGQTVQFNGAGTGENFELMLQYIQYNYKHLTLDGLARLFHYNKTYLCSLIRKNTGCTYIQLVRRLKLREAAGYLVTTRMTVAEISGTCGYHSVDHFAREFKKEYGMTPGKYRHCQ